MRRTSALILAGGLLAKLVAQTDESFGVPVKIWGAANANFYAGEPGELSIGGPSMETYPGAADGGFTVWGSRANAGSFQTTTAVARLEPGKTYEFDGSGWAISTVTLNVIAPAGYQIEIDGVPRSAVAYNVPAVTGSAHWVLSRKFKIRLLASLSGIPARAGESSSLASNRVQWLASVGSLYSGTSAGAVNLIDAGTGANWNHLFSPAALDYAAPSTEVQVHRVSGVLRQILSNQALVDIVTPTEDSTLTSGQYALSFYRPNQKTGSSMPYTPTGLPYVKYVIEQGTTSTSLKITKITRTITDPNSTLGSPERTEVTTLERTGTAPSFTWTMRDWTRQGQSSLVEQVFSSSGTPPSRTTTLQVKVPSGAAALNANHTYTGYSWGYELDTSTVGTSNAMATTITYFDDSAKPGSRGLRASTVESGGGWVAFDYWNDTAVGEFAGALKYRYRPFNNTPLTVTRDPTQGEVTYFEYTSDAFGRRTRPTLVETKIDNVLVSKAVTTYSTAAHSSSSTLIIVTAMRQDYVNASNSHTTTTKYFQEDAGARLNGSGGYNDAESFFRNRTHSITQPDGVRRSYAYQRGDFNEGTRAFSASTTGAGSRIVEILGTTNSSAGSLYSTYDGSYDIDDLYLISGKSTMQVTIRDARALIARTEMHVWNGSAWQQVSFVDFGYDYAGQLTSRVASNGATYEASYKGEQKDWEIDESGVKLSYTYDDAGRVATMTKDGGATTTFTYNAAGQVLSETRSASGTTETIVDGRTYDDAGRLSSETPAGLSATTVAYNPGARTRTITAPDGGAKVESYNLDGRLASLTGSAVVAQYYTAAIESDGRRRNEVRVAASNSPRWSKQWTDWLGRPLKTERPGFSATSQVNFIEENFYDDATIGVGRLYKTTRTNLAPTRYEYDALSRVIRSGLDVDDNGLSLNSNDRIIDADTSYQQIVSSWWLVSTQTSYPSDGSASGAFTSTKRSRLTGLASNRLSEVNEIDAEQNFVSRTVDVSRSSKVLTTTTTGPCNCAVASQTILNGEPVEVVTRDNLTFETEYDALGRKYREIDPRTGITTIAYHTGTALVASVKDSANNFVLRSGYDSAGRVAWSQSADDAVTYYSYTQRGELKRQWGIGSYPIEYEYNAYGERRKMRTWRASSIDFTNATSFRDSTYPSGTGDVTTWNFDEATGLLYTKVDAASNTTEFNYNPLGQVAERKWARTLTASSTKVTATYNYHSATGELWTVGYNDSAEAIPTPGLTYNYTRLGQLKSVTQGSETRTLIYDSSTPWRVQREELPASLGSRWLTHAYDATTESGGTFGSHTMGTFAGRPAGFDLGVSGNAARDLQLRHVYSNQQRFVGVRSQVGSGGWQDFVYAYEANSALIDGYSMGNFSVSRDYDANRDLVTRVETKWGTTSLTRFDFTHDPVGQRRTAKQSGTAFADYYPAGYSSVFNFYSYNPRGELQTSAMYRGDTVPGASASPSSADELPGRRFEYRYDLLGNRKTSGSTGGASGGDDEYQANALNQYDSRENNTVRFFGTAAASAKVAFASATTNKLDRAWAADLVPPNSAGPAKGTTTVYAAIPGTGGGADVIKSVASPTWLVPPAVQTFGYDADGNLISDGLWTYTYNAENQLVRMTSTLPAGSGFTRLRLDFKYDYLGRRVEKTVFNLDTSTQTLARRFVYHGWNLVAELDGSGMNLVRSYTWGLDLTGSLGKSGGIGALLQMIDHGSGKTYWPAYDGNGNVVSLVNASTGALSAVYEYDPFGNFVRAEVIDSTVADNPFAFSTKYRDSETGLSYYGYRYYSATLGRFVNRDPIAEAGGVNLYAFAKNDGVSRWDVLGLVVDLGSFPVVGSRWGGGSGSWTTFAWRINMLGRIGPNGFGSPKIPEIPPTPATVSPAAGEEIVQLEPFGVEESRIRGVSTPSFRAASFSFSIGISFPVVTQTVRVAPNKTERWSDKKCAELAGQIASTKEGLQRRLASATGSRGTAANDFAKDTREMLDNVQTAEDWMEDVNDFAGLRYDGPVTSGIGNSLTAASAGMSLGNMAAGIRNSNLELFDRGLTDLGQTAANFAGSQIFSHVANPQQTWVNFTGFSSRVTTSARFLASRGNLIVTAGGVIIKLTELNISLRQEAGMNQDGINDIYAWGAQTTEWKNRLSGLQSDYDKHCK